MAVVDLDEMLSCSFPTKNLFLRHKNNHKQKSYDIKVKQGYIKNRQKTAKKPPKYRDLKIKSCVSQKVMKIAVWYI